MKVLRTMFDVSTNCKKQKCEWEKSYLPARIISSKHKIIIIMMMVHHVLLI